MSVWLSAVLSPEAERTGVMTGDSSDIRAGIHVLDPSLLAFL